MPRSLSRALMVAYIPFSCVDCKMYYSASAVGVVVLIVLRKMTGKLDINLVVRCGPWPVMGIFIYIYAGKCERVFEVCFSNMPRFI